MLHNAKWHKTCYASQKLTEFTRKQPTASNASPLKSAFPCTSQQKQPVCFFRDARLPQSGYREA